MGDRYSYRSYGTPIIHQHLDDAENPSTPAIPPSLPATDRQTTAPHATKGVKAWLSSRARQPDAFDTAPNIPSPVAANSVTAASTTQKGKTRTLTQGEIDMCMTIFGNTIDFSKTGVHRGPYLPFQPESIRALAPNGKIYVAEDNFREDFSLAGAGAQQLFMHEMVHVWQYQLGYPVKRKGMQLWNNSYQYKFDEAKKLCDYDMEAQANIIADYYCWKYLDGAGSTLSGLVIPGPDLKWYGDHVLSNFLSNPADKNNLPKGKGKA
jgi:hypothetical protein